MGIVEQLRSDAEDHIEVANSCDCNPQDTVNWRHAENAREAATDGISSGLVAVAWNGGDMGREWTTDKIVAESWVNNSKTQQAIPVVLLEDAEAIISAKDAEIERLKRTPAMQTHKIFTLPIQFN